MFCERCGKSVAPTAAYCRHCGAPVADDADVVITGATTAPSDAPCETGSPVTNASSSAHTPSDTSDPQRTLFSCGVYSEIKHRGQTVRVNQALRPAVPRGSPVLKCRHCSRIFDRHQAKGSHERSCPLKNARSIQLDVSSMSGPSGCQCGAPYDPCCVLRSSKCRSAVAPSVASAFVARLFSEVAKTIVPPVESRSGGRVRIAGTILDRRKNNRGSDHRIHRSFLFKKHAIEQAEHLESMYPTSGSALAADLFDVNREQVNDWKRQRKKIFQECHNKTHRNRNMARKLGRKGKFYQAELVVWESFKARRAKGIRCGPRWVRGVLRQEVRKLYPGVQFKCGPTFLYRWSKRWGVSLRRRSNSKRVPIHLRVPKIQRYFALTRRRLGKGRGQAGWNPKWGWYLPEDRYCLDQVPAEGDGRKRTLEVKGAKRVAIGGNEGLSTNREASLQVLILGINEPDKPRNGQPPLCMGFPGTGKRISQEEKSQYHPDVFVQWQRRAWYDQRLCGLWALEVAPKSIPQSSRRKLIYNDNLSGQTIPTFIKDQCMLTSTTTLQGRLMSCQPLMLGLGLWLSGSMTTFLMSGLLRVLRIWRSGLGAVSLLSAAASC